MIARRAVLIAPALAGLFALGGRGFGQEFPTGPITFVVSFPPGGSIDVVMRAMAVGNRGVGGNSCHPGWDARICDESRLQ
jgi:tripartite-type tricarboxylate transporter receptor subunit TctC